MRATTERPVGVDHALAGPGFEEGARASDGFRKFLAAGGAKTFRGDERLAFGELRGQPGELELATLGAGLAVTFQRTLRQFRIDRADFIERGLYFFSSHV